VALRHASVILVGEILNIDPEQVLKVSQAPKAF
jgi:hypothetical protein